jgi:pimeloyl-ACP methyl ester carboxylesterase
MLDEDRSADLPRISAPTRIVWGDFDTYADRAQQRLLAAAIAEARLSIHPGAGHSPHWEVPKLLATELAALQRDGAKLAA